MQAYVVWWILAAVLVGVELTSGTFYLLVYGLAAAAAGVIAALGTLALRHWKRSTGHPESSVQDMDIGQTVLVESWQGGRGQVKYRGALWMSRPNRPASTARIH